MKNFLLLLSIPIILSSCGTIAGGSKFTARVEVEDHPNARIVYNGFTQGKGFARLSVKRNNISNLTFTVKEEGCETQSFSFTNRQFRIAPFILNILFMPTITTQQNTGNTKTTPLPLWHVIDFATGAVWKPSTNQKGVYKSDYKNFNFMISDYTGCKGKKAVKTDNDRIFIGEDKEEQTDEYNSDGTPNEKTKEEPKKDIETEEAELDDLINDVFEEEPAKDEKEAEKPKILTPKNEEEVLPSTDDVITD